MHGSNVGWYALHADANDFLVYGEIRILTMPEIPHWDKVLQLFVR